MNKILLVLGDSLTNFGEQPGGWARLLDERMCTYTIKTFGRNGYTSSDYVRELPSIVPIPDLRSAHDIVIWLGTNDILKMNDFPISNQQFNYNIKSMIDYLLYINPLLQFTLISVPINNYTITESNPYKESKINSFNVYLEHYAKENNFKFINLNNEENPNKLTSSDFIDGVHFNEQGNEKIYLNLAETYKPLFC